MQRRKARSEDYTALCRFYDEVIDQQENDLYTPMWTKGIYPAESDIAFHLENGHFLLLTENGEIAAAAALDLSEDKMYRDFSWPSGIDPSQVAVIHLLAVNPSYRRRHLGHEILEYCLAEAAGCRQAVHLDVMPGNLSAERLYLSAGFVFAGEKTVFYPDTGEVTVRLFEYVF
ncbi:MAG: GNAT family N-acetyltransferase [Erysipelotrichaceae bacterium]|nr:GNAT family N-acetyltransferase [Erysipelotrichaceae bacterium]